MILFLKATDDKGNETIILNSLYTKEELQRELLLRVERKSMSKTEAYEILNNGIKAPVDGSLRIKFSAKATILLEKVGGITEYTDTVRKGTVLEVYSNCSYKRATKLDYIMSAMVARMYA